MVGLNNNLRSQGGQNRAKNQSASERKLHAMIAAGRRPLLHDANLTPEAMLADFEGLIESRDWFCAFIVAADRSKVPYTTRDEVLTKSQAGSSSSQCRRVHNQALEDVSHFDAGEQFDDITLIVAKRMYKE